MESEIDNQCQACREPIPDHRVLCVGCGGPDDVDSEVAEAMALRGAHAAMEELRDELERDLGHSVGAKLYRSAAFAGVCLVVSIVLFAYWLTVDATAAIGGGLAMLLLSSSVAVLKGSLVYRDL